MQLSERDQALLSGELGAGPQLAMELLTATATAVDAPSLIDISGAHIDSCLYHGRAGLDFAQTLAEGGATVSVPSTLNVSSLDLLHPELYRGDPETAEAARELMDAYEAMGCTPTWTCAPYQLQERPGLGEQVAWGESNAIVFANSVLGARTERYGDFLDICCAITGRAPNFGLHTDEGRYATMRVELELPDRWLDQDLLYPLVGHVVGHLAGTEVALIVGLDERADEDRLKALGAAAASSGAVAMFHVLGVTPEAESSEMATGGRRVRTTATVDRHAIEGALQSLDRGTDELGAVCVGTPHASAEELRAIVRLATGRSSSVPFYVNTGRDVLASLDESTKQRLENFGATVVVDTCTYITPIIGDVQGTVMTDSGKWAYYAPGNLGVAVTLASVEDCVESAIAGECRVTGLP